jgi:tRNA A-37 threonylcarbamoyl transferase component Bud32
VVVIHAVARVVDPEDGKPADAIILEHLEAERLDDLGPVSVARGREICHAILDGVEHIHKQGFAHGDLHGGNVLVNETDVKLIDLCCSDPLSVINTAGRTQLFQRDVGLLRPMLCDVADKARLDMEAIQAFHAGVRQAGSIADLRAAVDAAFSQ